MAALAGSTEAGKVYFPDELHQSSSVVVGAGYGVVSPVHDSSFEHFPVEEYIQKQLDEYDSEPGLFAPAMDKPFERARTLTGKYYMPELAYEKGSSFNRVSPVQPPQPLKSIPIAVSGTLLRVGVPVSLGNYDDYKK